MSLVSMSPDEAMKIVDAKAKDDLKYERRVEAEEGRLVEEANRLKKYVYESSNPSPILVVGMCILLIVLIWVIYVVLIKHHIDGVWAAENGDMWNICHNKFSNSVHVMIEPTKGPVVEGSALLSGNLFKFKSHVGIWNGGDVIMFGPNENIRRVIA